MKHPSSVLDTIFPVKVSTNNLHLKDTFVRIFYPFESYYIFLPTKRIQERVRRTPTSFMKLDQNSRTLFFFFKLKKTTEIIGKTLVLDVSLAIWHPMA